MTTWKLKWLRQKWCAAQGNWLNKDFNKGLSRWWFQICFVFTPIWGRFPIWLMCFRWVGSATNQPVIYIYVYIYIFQPLWFSNKQSLHTVSPHIFLRGETHEAPIGLIAHKPGPKRSPKTYPGRPAGGRLLCSCWDPRAKAVTKRGTEAEEDTATEGLVPPGSSWDVFWGEMDGWINMSWICMGLLTVDGEEIRRTFKPVEVGSWYPIIYMVSKTSQVVIAGFLNHQQF